MARSTPQVNGVRLVYHDPSAQSIIVGTPSWYDWLKQATTFAFTSDIGRFTARKERRGRTDGYWRAYRRRAGHLYSVYLGKSADLTFDQLQAVASALDDTEPRASIAFPQPDAAAQDLPDTHVSTLPHLVLGGTVTFLLCELGDTGLATLQAAPQSLLLAAFTQAVADGHGILLPAATAIRAAAFASPAQAVRAAIHIQRTMARLEFGGRPVPPTRMALHTGVTALQAAHGGYTRRLAEQLLELGTTFQVLLSHVTAELVRDHLPVDARLYNLGSYILDTTNRPERIYQLVIDDNATAPTALLFPARRPHNLPRPLTALVGREMDIAAVIASLQQLTVRLLTLTGPGGVGKTRLSVAVAAELRTYFADGCFFVDLAAFHTPELVTQQIAQTLGMTDAQPQAFLSQLCEYLAPRSVLLVLDNVEQVRSIAPMLSKLLHAASELKILATSRSVLRLTGEHEYPVAPLALPGLGAAATFDDLCMYPAVRLFVERAQAARPDFALTAHNATAIAALCRQLDGLPLAIELAAVRCRLFSPDALLQRIERRLALLTGGTQDLPARQQTLRATLDWSYRLLDLSTQVLLRRLAVFTGGFTLEAAEAICSETRAERDAVIDGLAELVDQSLLQGTPAQTSAPRFTMLETLHEYATELLNATNEADALHERHAIYCCELAERAAAVLEQGVDRDWLDQLETERTNMRAALRWLLEHQQFEMAARLGSALMLFWDLRSARREGYNWLATMLVHADALSLPIRAQTQYAAGYLARALHDRETAIPLFTASIACYRALADRHGLARALQSLAWAQIALGGDIAQPIAWLDESLALARELNDMFTIGWALQCLGWIEQYQALGHTHSSSFLLQSVSWVERFPGSLAQARALHAESLAVRRAAGNPHSVAWALFGLGMVAAAQRDTDAARAYQEERLAIERSLGNSYGAAEALRALGVLALRQGDYATARTWLIECLALARELGERYTIYFALMMLGEVAHAEGDTARAASLFDEALAGFTHMQDKRRIARAAVRRAQVALEDGALAQARLLMAHGVANAQMTGDLALVNFCLNSLADSIARAGDAAWAAQLWGTAESQAEFPSVRYIAVEPAAREQLQADARRLLVAQTFAALWAEGRNLSPEAALEPPSAPASLRPGQTYGLTRRELDVLRLLTEGCSNAEIATQLVISVTTVNTYLSAIYRKLNVSSRTAAMRFALDHLM